MKEKFYQIVGVVFAIANLLWTISFAYLFYCHHFTNALWLFMYPDWVLIVNITIGSIGFYISMLLFRNKLKMIFFLIIEVVLLLIGLSTTH
jgi:hypothetical protein